MFSGAQGRMGACGKQPRLWGQSEDVSFAGRAMALLVGQKVL